MSKQWFDDQVDGKSVDRWGSVFIFNGVMWGIVVLSTFVSLTVFVLACAGLQLGVWLEMILPREHLTSEARSTAQIGIGMMATLAALVLGLMITSAKSSFDRVTEEVVDVSTSIVLIDRSLAGYGDDARQARTELRDFAVLLASDVSHFSQIKAASSHDPSQKPLANLSTITALQLTILALHPTNDSQRWFQTRALSISAELGHQRVLTAEQGSRTLPATLLVVLTSWVVLIFVGLGVFTVGNHSVRAALVFSAFVFAGAIFLILELDTPYSGVICVSGQPLENAVAELGK